MNTLYIYYTVYTYNITPYFIYNIRCCNFLQGRSLKVKSDKILDGLVCALFLLRVRRKAGEGIALFDCFSLNKNNSFLCPIYPNYY